MLSETSQMWVLCSSEFEKWSGWPQFNLSLSNGLSISLYFSFFLVTFCLGQISRAQCAATNHVGNFASESAAAAPLRVNNGRKASSLWLRLVYETKIPQEDKILMGNEHFQYDSTSPYSRSHYIGVRRTLHHPPISLKLGIMTPRMPPNVILMELTYEESYIPLPKQQEFSKTGDDWRSWSPGSQPLAVLAC